jgi:hypothetical protein
MKCNLSNYRDNTPSPPSHKIIIRTPLKYAGNSDHLMMILSITGDMKL